jgi:phosphate transport system permease protein
VRAAEKVARALISIGGIGTILAVISICAFLLWVVAPLLRSASIGEARASPAEDAGSRPLHIETDEQRLLTWTVLADGTLRVLRNDTGGELERRELFPGRAPTASAFRPDGAVFGFGDGELRRAKIRVATSFLDQAELAARLGRPAEDDVYELEHSLLVRIAAPQGAGGASARAPRFRSLRVEAELGEPLAASDRSAVLALDEETAGTDRRLAVLHEDGSLWLLSLSEVTNLLTGETRYESSEHRLPAPVSFDQGKPEHVLLSNGGSVLYLVWRDGRLLRFDARDPEAARIAEEVDLLPETGAEVTAFSVLAGRSSLLVGDSRGRVSVWFTTKPPGAESLDGNVLRRVHLLEGPSSPVTALAPSARSRLFWAGYRDGSARLFHATSARELGAVEGPTSAEIAALAMAPREDGVVAWTRAGLWTATCDAEHPEASLSSILLPVWYEGYPHPAHVWSSTSGTDEFEPKLGLMPLIFGTLKATLYSMAFGAPLALLAAIFSSEFLDKRLRVPVKSTIEMMASLPSVVLGFLAAMVIAPFVQAIVPTVLCAFVTLPLALLLGAYLWQLLPRRWGVVNSAHWRFASIYLALPLGVLGAWWLGPASERLFFSGDFLRWLEGGSGSALGGWLFLFLPLAALGSTLLMAGTVQPWLRRVSLDWSPAQCARADIARFSIGALVALVLALALSALATAAGLDLRGHLIGTYVQRNALIVGFAMGFAIIPIIYTLAEDALASVPSHLRLASLGCGATPWQTAVRVVVPTAMSGLFSAVMIGLGRAVGETMIVLMAAGNTAVMDWNIFSGFRTLSANIAVELPEAVQGSTHYRMLFLASLALFSITFLVNTAAEVVRQRFRRRAFQL